MGAAARRGISQSAAPQKALPFALNTTRSETAPAEDASGARHDGKMLRMIMFGASCVWNDVVGVPCATTYIDMICLLA